MLDKHIVVIHLVSQRLIDDRRNINSKKVPTT